MRSHPAAGPAVSGCRRHRALGLTVLPAMTSLALMGACSSPPAPIDPAALAAQASVNAADIVHTAGGGVAFTQDQNSGAQKILNGLTNIQSKTTTTTSDGGSVMPLMQAMPTMALPPAMMRSMAENPMIRALAGDGSASGSSLRTTEEQFDDTASDLRLWLSDRILVPANLELRTDDAATYLLHADPTCRRLNRPEDPPGTVWPIARSCQDQLEKLQVRVVMRADGDGIQLELLLGPDRLQLSVFTIHSDLLAWEVDLPRAKAAADFGDHALGQDNPMDMTSVTALTGHVRVSLHKDGDRKVTFTVGLPQALHVASNDSAGNPQVDLTVAQSDALLSLTGDGVAKRLTVAWAVGATDIHIPWRPMGTEPANLDAHVAVGGLFGATTVVGGGNDEVRVTGLGIGDSSFDVKGAQVFDLSLNPMNNHRFDFVATLNTSDQPRVELSPRFDLSLAFKLMAIAAQLKSAPPSYLLDETYRVQLVNVSGPSVVEVIKDNGAGFSGGLKITAGTLTLASTKVAAPVVVTAGQCLTSVKSPPMDAHPILGALTAAPCP